MVRRFLNKGLETACFFLCLSDRIPLGPLKLGRGKTRWDWGQHKDHYPSDLWSGVFVKQENLNKVEDVYFQITPPFESVTKHKGWERARSFWSCQCWWLWRGRWTRCFSSWQICFFLTTWMCCTRCSSSWPTCRPPRTPPGRRRAAGFSSTIRSFRCKVICCSFPQLFITKLPPCFSEGCSTSCFSFNF